MHCPSRGLDAIAQGHLAACKRLVPGDYIGVSMWSDGVPVSWDRSESVQCWTWHLPGPVSQDHRTMRIPFTVVPKHFCNQQTMDFVLELLGWSLQQMFVGTFPSSCHDGSAFEEAYRQKLSGTSLGYRGLLLEIKGDWEFFPMAFICPGGITKRGFVFCVGRPKSISPSTSWMLAGGNQP